MPRRREPDPFALQVGIRIRQLREEQGLTMEKLAFESELGSKGHLSNLERGLARPTIHTLRVLAERLEVDVLDLLTFPDQGDRQKLVDLTRHLGRGTIRKLLKDILKDMGPLESTKEPAAPAPPPKKAAKRKSTPAKARKKKRSS
ncbi:helix-turn-helix domain-containing protein [Polyangium jinanense]|uniref:Helix-turn-helix transcriptional regulator n=1 Tax=Polyangium jinanense TaxID=2829994 RepID=A0A9X3X9E7_9BACT|nr:helix-turn-helix transcriptional regulator [Polyangium jinanense]MDC3959560.1 helix-turn-helix transcriptional regulator [Polyangium jinanense]MDC3986159.1 helix-turn-helix transcriptional regulator [Polyangium jinanense]